MSKNHALMAAKAARARLHEKSLREPADGFDPIALCFSRHWLPTLGRSWRSGQVPRTATRGGPSRGALRIKRERRAAALEASDRWWRRGVFFILLSGASSVAGRGRRRHRRRAKPPDPSKHISFLTRTLLRCLLGNAATVLSQRAMHC